MNMEISDKPLKNPIAAVWSATVVAVFVAAITIAGEFLPALKDWLKVTFSHHWIGKSVLSAALFVALYGLFYSMLPDQKAGRLVAALRVLSWVTILAALSIYGFFTYETFK